MIDANANAVKSKHVSKRTAQHFASGERVYGKPTAE